MSLHIFQRQLKLVSLLAGNRQLDVNQLAEVMHMGRRQIYRYLELLRQSGFLFNVRGSVYTLLPSSPYLHTLRRRLNGDTHPYSTPAGEGLDAQQEDNLAQVCQALAEHRQVIIRNYHSQNSHTTTDRTVEPFHLFPGGDTVLCFEVATHKSKTFRFSRMESVQVLPTPWQHAEEHELPVTDMFGYNSTQEPTHVTLRLTPRAHQLLIEEYQVEQGSIEPLADLPGGTPHHYLLHTYYCHCEGIGRFVMGLAADIEIIDDPVLTSYVTEQFQQFMKK